MILRNLSDGNDRIERLEPCRIVQAEPIARLARSVRTEHRVAVLYRVELPQLMKPTIRKPGEMYGW